MELDLQTLLFAIACFCFALVGLALFILNGPLNPP